MSNSFEFCKERASDPNYSSYSDRPWKNAIEIGSTELFDKTLCGIRHWGICKKDNEDEFCIDVELVIDPDADFDYFTSSSSIHDGTFLFIYENINMCINNIITAATYNKTSRPPQAGDSIKYTVGNLIVCSEFDKGENFTPEDKMWMRERTTVLLPVKYEVKKYDKNNQK